MNKNVAPLVRFALNMEINGKVIQVFDKITGVGKTGNNWQKQEFILEQPGQYPKKVMISVWGEKVDQFAIRNGEEITASVDVESREYNGRWYTDVKAWNIQRKNQAQSAQSSATADPAAIDEIMMGGDFSAGSGDGGDDLPF